MLIPKVTCYQLEEHNLQKNCIFRVKLKHDWTDQINYIVLLNPDEVPMPNNLIMHPPN